MMQTLSKITVDQLWDAQREASAAVPGSHAASILIALYHFARTMQKRRTITLDLPLPPKEAHPNVREHWHSKARAIASHRSVCGDLAAIEALKTGGRPRWSRAVIGSQWSITSKMPHDPDNLLAWMKSTVDALRDAGILADDREIIYTPPIQAVRQPKAGLLLSIRELPEEYDGHGIFGL